MAYRFFTGVAEAVLRGRWWVVALVTLLTVGAVSTFGTFRINSRNEIWFVENDPQLLVLRKFERIFRNDDFIYVLVESDDFFREEIIRRFGALADDLAENVPYVADATWIGNAEFIEGRAEDVVIEEVMDGVPSTDAEMSAARRRSFGEPVYVGSLISEDARAAGLILEMAEYPTDDLHVDPRKTLALAVRRILDKPEYEGLDLLATGSPLLDYAMDRLVAREMTTLMVGCVLVQMLILFWVGRGWRGVVVPLVVVNLSVAWTFGAIRIYGYDLNLLAAMLPLLLICVGIGDSMHLIAEVQNQHDAGLGRHDALVRAFGRVGLPCVLTSITTAAGFLSFLAAPVRPYREMGVYGATGVALALLLTFLVVPLFYWWGAPSGADRAGDDGATIYVSARRNDLFDRMLTRVHAFVTRCPGLVATAFGTLTALALIGFVQVEIQSSTIKMLSPRVELRQTYDRVDSLMGGTMAIEIMFDTGQPNAVIEPEFLAKMERLERFIKTHPYVSQTSSVLDLLRQMRRAFHENRQEYYTLPVTRQEVSQYLLLYEMSGGSNKEKFLTYEYDVARLTARTRAIDSKDVEIFLDELRVKADEIFDEDVDMIEYTGFMAFLGVMARRIGDGQKRSFAAAAAVITLIMIVVLRSVRMGLISMIPNIFPVIMTLGLMGITGMYLDLSLMSVSAIIIGVAVDDTIHFFLRFRREFSEYSNYSTALLRTYRSVGRPIMFTTLTLTLGFAVLLLSSVTGMAKFGGLAGYAFSWALLADFLFAPAVLLLARPLGPERLPEPLESAT